MKKIILGLAMALLTAGPLAAQTEATPEPTPEKKPFSEVKRDAAHKLRVLNEGFLFMIHRYSMIDATLGAQERGKDYGHSLWLGMIPVPSAGQYVNEEYLKASGVLIGAFFAGQNLKEIGPKEEERRDGAAETWLDALKVLQWGLQSYAMIDAAYMARAEGDMTYDRAFWIGASSALPGVGQFINHDWWKGGGLFAGFVVLERLTDAFERMPRRGGKGLAGIVSRLGVVPVAGGGLAAYRTEF